MTNTDADRVSDIVARLRAGKANTPGHVVVWVENMRALIDTNMFRTFPKWREVFRREFDALLAASDEAADIIEAQSKALAEAREDVAEDDPSTGLAAKFIEGFDVGYREALLAARPTDPAVAVPAAELLAIRDALLAGDLDDAWHHLYTIADPEFCQMEPWRNLEHKARTATPTPENPNG